jgi:hypothetical protein
MSAPSSTMRLAFLVFAVLLLAGCAPVSLQAPTLIEYQRSGGIAGRTDRLVINGDGTARLERRSIATDVTIPADTVARLRALLQGIRFDTLRAEYAPPRPGADMYEYVLVHDGKRVRCGETAVPPELGPLIDLLNRMISAR